MLELACGSGQFTFRLAKQAHRWEATDFSEKMVAEAKKRPGPPNLRFAVRDATSLPDTDGTFDAVFIGNALHIMPKPEKALAEICHVLKPGGILLAPTFLWGANGAFRFRARLMELVGFRVRQRWDADGLAAFVARRGFAVLERDVPSVGDLAHVLPDRAETIRRNLLWRMKKSVRRTGCLEKKRTPTTA